MPLRRVWFTLRMGHRHRRNLAQVYRATPLQQATLQVLPQQLKADGIEIVALDFDGVLGVDGALEPDQRIRAWLRACIEEFGAERVFILTNQPRPQRLACLQRDYPGLTCLTGVRKKPYPDGLQQLIQHTGVQPQHIALLDDRLLTGVLAACITGVKPVYIRRPLTDFRRNFWRESFFSTLRCTERGLCRFLSRRKPTTLD